MSVTDRPWFHAESLRAQFSRDIADALQLARITEQQAHWLESLVSQEDRESSAPRVDRLSPANDELMHAELAGALIISDPNGVTPQIYLSTSLNGLERFDSREQLVARLTPWFGRQGDDPKPLEYEQIESDVFEANMWSIVDQQVQQLHRANECLQDLPTLHTAIGRTLQQQINTRLPGMQINVFTHRALIKKTGNEAANDAVLGSQTLVDAAMRSFSNTALPAGIRQQFLDRQGRELNEAQAEPYERALAGVDGGLANVYENLLGDYWRLSAGYGKTRHDLVCAVFTGQFRQQLLEARHQNALKPEEYAALQPLCVPGDSGSTGVRISRLSIAIGRQEPVKLAGMFLLEFTSSQLPDLVLYSPKQGLQRFVSMGAVAEYIASIDGRTQVFEHASLNDHPLLRTQGALHLRLDSVSGRPLVNAFDSLVALQKRDLASVLRQSFTSVANAAVAVEQAMNIRRLIDPRLSVAHGSGRWGEAMAASERNWSAFSSPARISELNIHINKQIGDHPTLPWAIWLRDARARVDSLFDARPTAADCAHMLLNRYFSILSPETVDARQMWLNGADGGVVSLTVFLIEQVTGRREAHVPQDCHVHIDPADSAYSRTLSWLTADLLEQVMSRCRKVFVQEHSRLIRAFRRQHLRTVGSQVIPADASRLIREGLLRLELSMQRNSGEVSDHGLGMLQQILERPDFKLRETQGSQATRVYVPALTYDSSQPAIPLTNVMVLQKPEGKPLLWSAVLGLQEFDTLQEINISLNARLGFPGSRHRWTSLIAEPDQPPIRRFLTQSEGPALAISMIPVDGNFLEHLETAELQRQSLGIESVYRAALDWQVDAGLLAHMLMPLERDDKARTIIDTLSGQLELTLLSGEVPGWLKDGSTDDLVKFRQLLVRFWQLYNARESILSVPSLIEYAAAQLQQILHQDFPAAPLDPGRIKITLTRYTVAPVGAGEVPSSIPAATGVVSESLTLYAINHFLRFQEASLSVSSEDATPLPAGLDALYVRNLVRTLDIGTKYEHYLKQTFSETAPDHAERLRQFVEQAPSALLLSAFTLKMQGLLSSTGYELIETVFSMPDGLARLPVHGRRAIIIPLSLIASAGYAADRVAGVYLIAAANHEGPWILHAVADADFSFKEYASLSAFVDDLHTSRTLQAMILERLDPMVRYVYQRDGFIQPHLSWASGGLTDLSGPRPGPVQPSLMPLQTNALHDLFQATQRVMVITARKNSVTTEQADGAESTFLLQLGAAQVLTFLPGTAGGLVGLWQARELAQSSLNSAADDEWGRATAEFTAALAVLISLRRQSENAVADPLSDSAAADELTTSGWHDPQLRSIWSARLRPFEAHDVSLSTLLMDNALNVYNDPVTRGQYAAVFGKVYEVRQGLDGWRVIGGEHQGPRIRLDSEKQWAFDTELGIRRDGGVLTRLRSVPTNMDVNDLMLVEARGVAEIQRLYPYRARHLLEAHDLARHYLENALDNLTVPAPQRELNPRVARIITDFFGVQSQSNVSILPIKKAVIDIYNLLVDPSLSPHSSERFVVGSNKLGYEEATAFNFQNDPLQRIFFTEQFFATPVVRLKPIHVRRGSFNAGSHFRATILIHELSHVASGTHDIAYVDSTAPYLDLLDDTGNYRARLKREQRKAQENLSHMTPREELFRIDVDDAWRDLRTADGDAKSVILKLTDTSNLEDARDKFLHDPKTRAKVILSNADSVALLVTLLGRERF